MQTKAQLIYNDVCVLAILVTVLAGNSTGFLLKYFIGLFVFFFIRQTLEHRKHYKINHRLY